MEGSFRGATAIHLVALFFFRTHFIAEALVFCNETSTCERQVRPGSVCLHDFASTSSHNSTSTGVCSNPFASGCLQAYLGPEKFPHRRICNSHDTNDDACDRLPPVLEEQYNELRILYQDWDGASISAWVMQIFLSEVVRVPTSLEASDRDASRVANFYNPIVEFGYGKASYNYDAMETALEVRDCRLLDNDPGKEYRACAHIMPECWNGQRELYEAKEDEGLLEPVEGAGGVAKYSWYIPRFVAEQDPSLLSHFGLKGTRENRRKLAAMFQKPTSWADYCRLVSPSNCTDQEEPENNILVDYSLKRYSNESDLRPLRIATRPPNDDDEGVKYFVEGHFNGYFQPSPDNDDCDAHPDECTGNFIDVPCTWSTFSRQQAFWNSIPVKADGPETNGGYGFLRMLEIYAASNATRSPVMFYWFTPDPTFQSFIGEDAEFQRILLPEPSLECVESRAPVEDRCSTDTTLQVGSPLGSCDSEPHSYKKLIVSNLYDDSNPDDDALVNPSYEAIKRFRISDLELSAIFEKWYAINKDKWGHDPKEATCEFVAENLDELSRYVPRSFPRKTVERGTLENPVHRAAISVGAVSWMLVLLTAAVVLYLRDTAVMRYAQMEFLNLIMSGLLLVASGAILKAMAPTAISCVAASWLVLLGFTLEMVPIIVKVAAIHRLVVASQRMRRVRLKRTHLLRTVAVIIGLVVVYLVCLTWIDAPTPQRELQLRNSDTPDEDGFYILDVTRYCAPDEELWVFFEIGWQVLLLLLAVTMAFQTRHISSEFNESARLGLLVYSHAVFLVLQTIIFALRETISMSRLQGFQSLVTGADTIFAVVIYFLPMFVAAGEKEKRQSSQSFVGTTRFFNLRSMGAMVDGAVKQISGTSGQSPSAFVDYMDEEAEDDEEEASGLPCEVGPNWSCNEGSVNKRPSSRKYALDSGGETAVAPGLSSHTLETDG